MNYKILSLHLYPIKSCAGFSVSEVQVMSSGFQMDRQWMIVDQNGEFLSQRKYPSLAQIKTRLKETSEGLYLEISIPGFKDPFIVSTHIEGGKDVLVKVWNDEVLAKLESSDLNQALSEFLTQSVRLVRFGNDSVRKSDIHFKDSSAVLVTNSESLKELENKIGDLVPMNRFRANIVIQGNIAFEEDTWPYLQIGDVRLKSVGPCSRCVIINVDQNTGKSLGPEPLKTLSQIRRFGKRVNFGQYFIPETLGKISLTDLVTSH